MTKSGETLNSIVVSTAPERCVSLIFSRWNVRHVSIVSWNVSHWSKYTASCRPFFFSHREAYAWSSFAETNMGIEADPVYGVREGMSQFLVGVASSSRQRGIT